MRGCLDPAGPEAEAEVSAPASAFGKHRGKLTGVGGGISPGGLVVGAGGGTSKQHQMNSRTANRAKKSRKDQSEDDAQDGRKTSFFSLEAIIRGMYANQNASSSEHEAALRRMKTTRPTRVRPVWAAVA